MVPSATVTHQAAGLNIASEIKAVLNKNHSCRDKCCILMETDWQVSNDTVVRPDVMAILQCISLNRR